MLENQTTETVLLENCIKQYQVLITALKEYLQSICKNELHYDEIKRNLFIAIKMILAVEEVMKVYNDNK